MKKTTPNTDLSNRKACQDELGWRVILCCFITRQSLEDRLLDCYIESYEGAPKDKVCLLVFVVVVVVFFFVLYSAFIQCIGPYLA